MAEITKVTTPMIPKENLGTKNRPLTEQTFELNHPSKVHKPAANESRVSDREAGPNSALFGRAILQPVMRSVDEVMYNVQKMIALLQMGISTSDIFQTEEAQELFSQIFVNPDELLALLQEQDEASVLFKGESFQVLRDLLGRFEQHQGVRNAIVDLLKTFEYNVNTKNSIKSILYNCQSLLDYMFTQDREQFASYLEGLAQMLVPEMLEEEQAEAVQPEILAEEGKASETQESEKASGQLQQPLLDEQGKPVLDPKGNPVMQMVDPPEPETLSEREAAQLLKGNLLPLLGEIVVKYHQNGRIRDIVMVVVHNIVRVDKGTPEALKEAVDQLAQELRKVANLPENFAKGLLEAIKQDAELAKGARNEVMEKLAQIIDKTLHSPSVNNAPALRQAENLLLSLLQNQSSLMDVLHFMLPMQVGEDHLFAEMYVDPDSEEGKKRSGEQARKIFLTVDSEEFGSMELSFLQTGERVEFSMWCPEVLMDAMNGMRRTVGSIMQLHGYTMAGYKVERYLRPQTVAEVFPKLLNRKVGIDVRI